MNLQVHGEEKTTFAFKKGVMLVIGKARSVQSGKKSQKIQQNRPDNRVERGMTTWQISLDQTTKNIPVPISCGIVQARKNYSAYRFRITCSQRRWAGCCQNSLTPFVSSE